MCYHLAFGFFSLALTGVAYALLFDLTDWHFYLCWLVAVNGVTLVMYGLDRWIGRQDKVDTPEAAMHLLSSIGGFLGAWLGRAIFRYKVDWEASPWTQIIVVLSTIGHGVLAYIWLIRGLWRFL
jgi:uncharacterized membrane protein YsdA (DUF1294 family)